MSKQSIATTIYTTWSMDKDRKEIIELIIRELGVKPAYASTLYATAKKKAGGSTTKTPYQKAADQPSVTTHTPVKSGAAISNLSDRATLRMLREEFQAAINAVAAAHGLTADLGNIRYNTEGTSFTTKMTVETGGKADVADRKADKAADNFKSYAILEGLSADDFGKVFNYAGKTGLRIVGYNTRAKKYPISLEDANGRGYKVSGSQIKSALGH